MTSSNLHTDSQKSSKTQMVSLLLGKKEGREEGRKGGREGGKEGGREEERGKNQLTGSPLVHLALAPPICQ